MSKKNLPNRVFMWIVIGISMSLAIFDMFFLRDVFRDNLGFDIIAASITSFALATAANIAALMWGRQKGQREAWKSFMWGWILLGVAYFIIRGISFIENVVLCDDWSIEILIEQLVPVLVLTISYVGTGTMLEWAGSRLWDYDVVNYLNSKKTFKKIHSKVTKNRAVMLEMAKRLNDYDKYYDSLNRQYDIHMEKIRKNERSIVSLIVAKMIADHPEITPTVADKVMKAALEEREQRIERADYK